MRPILIWMACVAAWLGSASPATAADASLDRIIAAKTLRVGVAVNAPWVVKRLDGSFAGYDIDLTTAIAHDLGVTPTFVELPFGDLVARVAHGDVDIVASGLALTPERARQVVFSDPTGSADVRTVASIATVKALPAGTTLSTPAVHIAVLAHSTDEAAAHRAYPAATIDPYDQAADALAALVGGKAQAMVATTPVPQLAVRLYGAKLTSVGGVLTRTPEAFALRPDDIRLLQFVDNWIAARRIDGFIGNVRDHWFGGFGWLSDLDTDKANIPAHKIAPPAAKPPVAKPQAAKKPS